MSVSSPMGLIDALKVLAGSRDDQVVVTTMSAAREWMRLSQHPLDFHYLPSTMGGALSLGLGIATARPQRDVIVLNGDGCLLMNLGSLVTAALSQRSNLVVIVVDNGVYETTGGQKLVTTGQPIDLAGMARAAQFASVTVFDNLPAWQEGATRALALPRPHFIVWKVASDTQDCSLSPPGPMAERVEAFRAALDG